MSAGNFVDVVLSGYVLAKLTHDFRQWVVQANGSFQDAANHLKNLDLRNGEMIDRWGTKVDGKGDLATRLKYVYWGLE